MVSKTDPRYLSGEFVTASAGFTSVKDICGNTLRVKTDDPRYLSGEFVGVTKGRKHTNYAKKQIGLKNSERQTGNNNSQYGTKWIYNTHIKQNKKVKLDIIHEYLDNGWVLGYNKEYNKKSNTL